jgi:predicted TPR repeat methyltransferase
MVSITALLQKALDAHTSGQLDRAESHYRQILARTTDNATALHFLGVLMHQKGASNEGVELIQKALAQMPDEAAWHNDLGNIFAQLGRDDEAVAVYVASLEIDRNDAAVWNNLGAVLLRNDQLDNAVIALESAIVLNPQFEDALNNLGDALTRQGKIEAAARYYCTAYIAQPSNKPKRALALAYGMLGKSEDAARIYRLWLDEEPDNPIAKHLLAACSGLDVPARAPRAYLEAEFDLLADTFEAKLIANLQYRVPEKMGHLLDAHLLEELSKSAGELHVLDAGCGTGLCGTYLTKCAKRLVGVDLSKKSLAVAAQKKIYHQLIEADLIEYLSNATDHFDLIIAADTLIYFGELEQLLTLFAQALCKRGILLVSIEELENSDATFRITPSGRYSHSRTYLHHLLTASGFEERCIEPLDIRTEWGRPVPGFILAAVKQ